MGTAGHLIFGRFDGTVWGKLVHVLCIPVSTDGLGASPDVACLFRQEAPSGTYLCLWIFDFQGALVSAKGAFPMGQTATSSSDWVAKRERGNVSANRALITP